MVAWGIFASRVTKNAKTLTSRKMQKRLKDIHRTSMETFLAWPRIARTALKVGLSAVPCWTSKTSMPMAISL
jgi:hypothetical protein